MIRIEWIGLVVALLWVGCVSSEAPGVRHDPGMDVPEPAEAENDSTPPDPEDIVSGVGTIRYVDLEGGVYGIVADDGTRYNPGALEEMFWQDGLRVRYRLQIRDDVVTTQMWGQPVEVLGMVRLSP